MVLILEHGSNVCPVWPSEGDSVGPVSYTHLDVYKRQPLSSIMTEFTIEIL